MEEIKIKEALKKVIDPELGIDIVTLELIRDIGMNGDDVSILMTLTSPMCPFADIIIQSIENEIIFAGYEKPIIELTFDPPWQASEELRLLMGV